MKVADIMTKKVISVHPDTKVVNIAKLMTKHGIHGVPVADKNNNLVGIITMSDFFIRGYPNLYLPSYIDFIQKNKFGSKTNIDNKINSPKLVNATAKDIMSSNCTTIKENEVIEVLLNKYQTSSIKTIPVVDNSGKTCGIVARSDIIKLINI